MAQPQKDEAEPVSAVATPPPPPPVSLSVSNDINRALTYPEKAAIIIALLGAESAGPIVEKIEDRHLRSFMHALENLHQLPRDQMLGVVADFITELGGRSGDFRGGPDAARELVGNLFDEERANRLFGAPPPPPAPKTSADAVWSEIKKRKILDVSDYLREKKAPIIGIVLSQFSTDVAGEILAELPEDLAIDSVAQMSRDAAIDQRTIDAVAELIQIEFLSADNEKDGKNSVAFVSEVLGILPRERRDLMLETLERSNPEQAELIKRGMLTFEDLTTRLPTIAIPMIFRDFDQVKLLKALKAGEEQAPTTIEFFYGNISQRMAGQYKEQVEEITTLSQKEGDNAISSMMAFISKLEREKQIELIKPPSEEG